MVESNEKYKILVMAIFLAGACYLTYYFHVVVETDTVFTHFFYIPIILASMWWRRKGLAVAIFLAVFLIFSHFFIRPNVETINDLIRAPMFIAVALVTAILSERIAKVEELKAKETQLIHAGRLSSLGEMATAIAHEINQPLSVISMAAESTLRDVEKKRVDVSALPKDLEDIMRNVKRIDRIITHMRTFARKTEEKRVVKPEEVLNNAFSLLDEQFRVHGISVSRKIEENLPLIEVDPNQLEQVFINILTNARQVLDERGEEAKREGKSFQKQLGCNISRQNNKIVFEFADNAYGVPDELKTRVFEPFFTTKESSEGTGLGLSIAYGIVTRSLGGKIWIEDNAAGGASFMVALTIGNRK